jgi:hypothetical protein
LKKGDRAATFIFFLCFFYSVESYWLDKKNGIAVLTFPFKFSSLLIYFLLSVERGRSLTLINERYGGPYDPYAENRGSWKSAGTLAGLVLLAICTCLVGTPAVTAAYH